jgi:RNA polymerase sigma-70 factor (ECF subfamily)
VANGKADIAEMETTGRRNANARGTSTAQPRPVQARYAPVADDPDGEPTDADLVLLSRTDPQAFGLLYDRYCNRIYRFVHSRLRDVATAEDVTADVFFKALRGLHTYQPTAGRFSVWLFRIARNAVIDHVRARRPTLSLDADFDRQDLAPPVEEQVLDRVDVARVWREVDGLPTAQRTAVILRLERDLPIADIAVTLNRSEGAVRVLLHRALTTLRARLSVPRAGSSG